MEENSDRIKVALLIFPKLYTGRIFLSHVREHHYFIWELTLWEPDKIFTVGRGRTSSYSEALESLNKLVAAWLANKETFGEASRKFGMPVAEEVEEMRRPLGFPIPEQ